jgi:hypothetical protein
MRLTTADFSDMKDTTPELLRNQFESENILVDLRLHDKITMASVL